MSAGFQEASAEYDRLLSPGAELMGDTDARVAGGELHGAAVLGVGPALHVTGAGQLPDVPADRRGVEHRHLGELPLPARTAPGRG